MPDLPVYDDEMPPDWEADILEGRAALARLMCLYGADTPWPDPSSYQPVALGWGKAWLDDVRTLYREQCDARQQFLEDGEAA